MLDLHCHVLPAVDDGSPDLEESRAMLDAAHSAGFTLVTATPHLVDALTPAYGQHVSSAFEALTAIASEVGITLVRGFEARLVPDLHLRLSQGEPSTLGGSRVVLTDLPFIDWPHHVESSLFNVQTAGFQPILAHPERYPAIQKDPALGQLLAKRGIALQVTIGSFAGVFGGRARRAAEALLRLGAVHLVATDAHSAGHRMAAVPDGLQRLQRLVGAAAFEQLTVHTPAALLSGNALPEPVTVAPRSWRSRLALRRR